jgi:pimeloyl-ACP methyl ester carboxylesterase
MQAEVTCTSMQAPNEFRVDIGDIELAIMEWVGTGDPVLLLHATGFHSRCWTEVVRHLPGRHIYAADLRFHGGSGDAGTPDWQVMAGDIRRLIEQLNLHRMIGVGHSIGGYLIARAAVWAPERFKHLVLVDPVIKSAQWYANYRLASGSLTASDHPVSRRKNPWHSAQEMHERFRDRAPFSTWQPAVLRDYCDYALRPAGADGLQRLACDPLNEAAIYLGQTGNEIILDELAKVVTPVTLLRALPGSESAPDLNNSPTWPGLASALPHCREIYLPHLNHLIPMQDPVLVADCIRAAR